MDEHRIVLLSVLPPSKEYGGLVSVVSDAGWTSGWDLDSHEGGAPT